MSQPLQEVTKLDAKCCEVFQFMKVLDEENMRGVRFGTSQYDIRVLIDFVSVNFNIKQWNDVT